MCNLSYEDYHYWRDTIAEYMEEDERSRFYHVYVINPSNYYNFEEKRHKTEKEVMEFDLHKLRTSNLVIVNFNDAGSLGTMAELAVAYEHRIPIIGLNENKNKLHPWQETMCNRIFDDMEELLEHVTDVYLN